MANVKVTLDYQINDGMSLTFKAPCDNTEVTGLKVYYPSLTDETETSTSQTFIFKDAHGNDLTNIGNLFTTGSYVKVVLDTTNGYAYIQNADTNGYLENKFNNIDVSTPINNHNTSPTAHRDIRNAVEAKYTKPSTGIPKTDLASSVQSSLALADTALQSLPSHNHDASDIVSGILPVIRGGTGVDSLASLATAMGSAKIQTGAYIGTGTYGESNPCSLTFDFVPSFFMLFTPFREMIATDILCWNNQAGTTGGVTYPKLAYTLSGTTLSWYYKFSGDDAAGHQGNITNQEYCWIALS